MSDETLRPDDADDRTQVLTGPPTVNPDVTVIVPSAAPAAPLDAPTTVPPAGRASAPPASTDAGVLPPGTRIAEFEITRLVGQGGFGAVYEVWDHKLEREAALKEYLPMSLSTRQLDGSVAPLSERQRETFDEGMDKFLEEARLLARFDHPSLLKVIYYLKERGTAYMVMPFYRGETLRQALQGIPGGVEEPWLMRILDGVTQALAVMHNAKCYHRDIAPDNIMLLEGSGRPVVLDFGAARRVITDKTQAITVILKPGYAPIEQYAEMPDMTQGAWTDVYALAGVMHVAVTGRAPPPSVARMLSDSYAPLVNNETLRQRYSVQLLSAIDAGLAVRPEQRPQSMAELRALLGLDGAQTLMPAHAATSPAPLAHSRPVPLGTTPAPLPASAPAAAGGGKGKAVAVASVIGLTLLGAGGWWWSQQGDGAKPAAPGTTVAAPPAEQQAAAPPAPSPPPPPPPPPPPVTPLQSMLSMAEGATPGFDVVATPKKSEVVIGRDRLSFEVRSKREGYAYVYLLSTDGNMFLLFPNLLDKYNKLSANTPVTLPRASWPMDAGGPAGTDQFVVLVSQYERDFSHTGVQNDGVFPRFPLPVLAALEAARGSGPPPLLGEPVCTPNTTCNDVYGVGLFKITEK